MTLLNQIAPDFNLRSTGQGYVSRDSLKGQTAILAFFPAAFTGVCQKELCTFNDSLTQLNNASVTVFGISIDGPLTLGAFKSQNHLDFELLSDHDRKATNAFGVAFENFAATEGYTVAQRAVFILDESGVVRFSWIAENPGIEPNYDEVIAAATNI